MELMVMWNVIKFGGSSLTKKGILNIVKIINKLNSKVVVVLSAIGNVTNLLIDNIKNPSIDSATQIKEIHFNLINELGIIDKKNIISKIEEIEKYIVLKEKKDDLSSLLIASGEFLSTMILNQYLNELGADNILIDARKVINSSNNSNHIGELTTNYSNFEKLSQNHQIVIMQGFIAGTSDNTTHLLTRGGSDTTATLVANMLSCESVFIYTDVNGIYTTDPNRIKDAQIIKNINYEMSQELSAMGAQVLHPYSIKPAQEKNIEIVIKNTFDPFAIGTKINNNINNQIAITNLSSVTLFHITSLNMWNNYGFVYDIFKDFSENNIDINIITTSQFTISCTTEENDQKKIGKVYDQLSERYQVKIVSKCNMISVVGNYLESISNKIFDITKQYDILMTHVSSNKLSISFIVENNYQENLHYDLHQLIVPNYNHWWKTKSEYLQVYMKTNNLFSAYFYSLKNIEFKCYQLKKHLTKIDNLYYAMKANFNDKILETITNNGFGLECVSINEIKLALNYTKDIIFTPNFCKLEEYKYAFDNNCKVIVDNLGILNNPIFINKKIGIRIDPIYGDGHHQKVITAGSNCKFGIDVEDLDDVVDICDQNNITIIGLHCHKGSGINNTSLWNKNIEFLTSYLNRFPDIEWFDLGGGLDINIDLAKINEEIVKPKNIKLILEPGRYLVATSGVLVSQVTQCKIKQYTNYIGIDTGMNSLIRPTLYDAYHPIHNISACNKDKKYTYTVVGPICESGDILGENFVLPETFMKDYLLIEECGAYGFSMSSKYNLRDPAIEVILYN